VRGMASDRADAMGEREGGAEVRGRLQYEPPSVVVLGTVQDLTRAGITGQSDGAGFEEIGGS
jgi:hypothetical protein